MQATNLPHIVAFIFLLLPGLPAIAADNQQTAQSATRSYPGLSNVVVFTDGLLSGSAPEGSAGFESLKKLGVRTVISVDGARPDIEAAKQVGLRYVHLPIGYNGFSEEQGFQLLRAVRDLPKPIYVHCYHGKHRSPAAAAFVTVGLGRATPTEAVNLMHVAGTSDRYERLYEIVRTAAPVAAEQLDLVPAEFPEYAKVSSLVAGMTAVDRSWERVKILREGGWKPTETHPDLDPVRETAILSELISQVASDAAVRTKPADFAAGLQDAARSSRELRDALKSGQADSADRAFNDLGQICRHCHERFRDLSPPGGATSSSTPSR